MYESDTSVFVRVEGESGPITKKTEIADFEIVDISTNFGTNFGGNILLLEEVINLFQNS